MIVHSFDIITWDTGFQLLVISVSADTVFAVLSALEVSHERDVVICRFLVLADYVVVEIVLGSFAVQRKNTRIALIQILKSSWLAKVWVIFS